MNMVCIGKRWLNLDQLCYAEDDPHGVTLTFSGASKVVGVADENAAALRVVLNNLCAEKRQPKPYKDGYS